MSTAWEAGKKVWEFAKWAFESAWDFGKSALKWTATWIVDVATWIWQWITDTIDIAWDVWATVTDFTTNMLTAWNWTNLMDKQWILDKASDSLNENYKGLREWARWALYWDQDISKTWEALNVAWQILWPGWWAKIVTKAPKAVAAVSKVIPFMDKLDDLTKSKVLTEVLWLKKAWLLTKESIAKISERYSPMVKNVMNQIENSNIVQWTKNVMNQIENSEKLKKVISTINPERLRIISEKYPRLSKIIASPEKLVEFAKNNPKTAQMIYSAIQWTDAIVNKETSGNIPDPHEDAVETLYKNVEQELSKEQAEPSKENIPVEPPKEKKIWEMDQNELQSKNKNLNVSSSIADNMKALGINNAFEARQQLYEEIYWEPYTWSAEQNIKLKEKIKDYSIEDVNNIIQWRSVTL